MRRQRGADEERRFKQKYGGAGAAGDPTGKLKDNAATKFNSYAQMSPKEMMDKADAWKRDMAPHFAANKAEIQRRTDARMEAQRGRKGRTVRGSR